MTALGPGMMIPADSDGHPICERCNTVFVTMSTFQSHECFIISHPAHYTRGKIEVIDFIEDQQLGYHLGQVIKYVCRAGFKDASTRKQDLQKAEWYLKREIERSV